MSKADNEAEPLQSVTATLGVALNAASLDEKVGELVFNLNRAFLPPGEGSLDAKISRAAGPLATLRLQYVIALAHVGRFLESAGAPLDTLNHFGRLGTALADLNSGAVHAILTPPIGTGRSPDATDIWAIRASAAVGLEFLIASGMKHKEAAALAARKAPGLRKVLRVGRRRKDIEKPSRPGKDEDLASSLLKWRAKLLEQTRENTAIGTAMGGVIAGRIFQGGKALLARYEDATSHEDATSMQRVGINLLRSAEAHAKLIGA
jgi:hypothetical protein